MAVADLPPRTLATIQEVCPYYELEGDSSRSLLEEFGSVIRQWQNRPGVVVDSMGDTESISHLPFRKAGTMRVRFKMAGAMTPRVIETEEAVEG
jgi:hypothetical protein